MKKFHMIVDLEKCVGCFNCMLACKDEHVGNEWLPYTYEQQKHDQKWINPYKHERGEAPFAEVCYVTKLCQHCDNPPCAKNFPDVVKKREDGIVIFDPIKTRGRKGLEKACPFGMISMNEEMNIAQKCTMCAHLKDQGWKEPRCVQACPLRAISIVNCEDSEFEDIVKSENLKSLFEGDHRPRVMYKNLYRYNKCFVTASLSYEKDGLDEAAVDAYVCLKVGDEEVHEQDADFLGEIKIDKIPKNSGKFTLECNLAGYEPVIKSFEILEKSIHLGNIKFEKKVK